MVKRNETFRFGSADFATDGDLRAAGMFEHAAQSIFVGFHGGQALYYQNPAGMCVTAGARGGKMRDFLAYNILSGTCLHTIVMLDMKGEGAFLSQDQTADRKFCGYWNPLGLHGLPQDRINPVGHLRIDSPTVVSDTKVFCENLIAATGSATGAYFEGRAREALEAIVLTLVEMNGVLTLPDLYRAINLIPTNSDAWLDLAFEMSESRFAISRRIEQEIAASRSGGGDGWQGILGELFKSVACLSDPVLMASVSPPFTMSLAQLCDSDQAWQLYLMPPAEFVTAWAPVIKSLFVGAMTYKSRAPSAPRQTWFLDECGQLAGGAAGGFPLVARMFTYGAGIGVQPVAIFQTNRQMRALGPEAEALITSSAGCRLMFALRDIDSAADASRMLGQQTLEYDDTLRQSRARHSRREMVLRLLSGGNPLQAGLAMAQHRREATHRSKQQRALRTPDEVMLMPDTQALLFADGLPHPALIERAPYWTRPELAGRFHPNPYHPPLDKVQVATRRGTAWKTVVNAPVPPRFAHFPQYRTGIWSRVEA